LTLSRFARPVPFSRTSPGIRIFCRLQIPVIRKARIGRLDQFNRFVKYEVLSARDRHPEDRHQRLSVDTTVDPRRTFAHRLGRLPLRLILHGANRRVRWLLQVGPLRAPLPRATYRGLCNYRCNYWGLRDRPGQRRPALHGCRRIPVFSFRRVWRPRDLYDGNWNTAVGTLASEHCAVGTLSPGPAARRQEAMITHGAEGSKFAICGGPNGPVEPSRPVRAPPSCRAPRIKKNSRHSLSVPIDRGRGQCCPR